MRIAKQSESGKSLILVLEFDHDLVLLTSCVATMQIRAAEDILALTRTMKETWLFGKLETLGETARDLQRREQLEKDVLAVQKAVEQGRLWNLAPGN